MSTVGLISIATGLKFWQSDGPISQHSPQICSHFSPQVLGLRIKGSLIRLTILCESCTYLSVELTCDNSIYRKRDLVLTTSYAVATSDLK